MPDPREDLRATADSIIDDADRLRALEVEKKALDPADPRVDQLSEQVERVVDRLEDKTAIERELSEGIGDSP
ncbi:MAG TPA: hypothetical protein VFO73_09125 [Candidatus Limnocylindrales bacterium]|nr:hypothetical protein [Candidatus Limnocylindrales bacterium]